jgi:hypothetical protein
MIGGPYHPPKCRIGSILRDKMLGPVRVVGRDENRWPLCEEPPRKGPNPLGEIPILTGDLVKAVCCESIGDISDHWSVPFSLVRKWRKAVAGTSDGVATALALKRYRLT